MKMNKLKIALILFKMIGLLSNIYHHLTFKDFKIYILLKLLILEIQMNYRNLIKLKFFKDLE